METRITSVMPDTAAVHEASPPTSLIVTKEVEQPVTLCLPPQRTVHLRGRMMKIQRGRQDLAVSAADLAGLLPEEKHE